ncbi:MarR family winged helix-turn-helix transcriptional regulator [Nocardioides sp.]|uniref:MarR family winged helix-turn-helix transcriptional regulator n=1 Tax=Nocardioides sp. TaxID=35761 RepID=UPI00260BE33A|nr:MarR family winged helix-turn-helix transcriptional regulator [Nocardioides sp.]MDI6909739.1 MarR family winged helix-turn-helix transcriptional regulator [Nocardioides sp.]
MSPDVEWLTTEQEQVWRRWLALNALLPAALHHALQADAGLSLPDFDVLVHLTDSAAGRVRVTDLAQALQWEKSRVSHHVTRMERRGLVRREECPDDARGAFVVVTPAGRAAIEQAAPGHVGAVRDLVFDQLTGAELASLDVITRKLLARLEPAARTGD